MRHFKEQFVVVHANDLHCHFDDDEQYNSNLSLLDFGISFKYMLCVKICSTVNF